MAHIRVGEELFNVAVNGPREAPVLLLSNSLGTDLRMWEPQIPELTKHFRVIRYDSRGHGESVAEPGPYTIERLGRDALAILDKLGVDKANFAGLSKGGMVGMWLLAHAPSRIIRAVLANTSAHMGMPDVWNARAQQAVNEGMAPLAKPTLERWFTSGFRKANPNVVAEIREMIIRTPPQGYAGCCLAIRDMDQRGALRSIRKPVLVIVGKHDPATPPAQGRLIAESIPGARLIELDAAHLSNVEAPEAFTAAVVGFLTGRAVGEVAGGADNSAPEVTRAAAAPPPRMRPVAPTKPDVAPDVKPATAPAAPVSAAVKPVAQPRKNAAKSQSAPAKRAAAKKRPATKAPAKKKVVAKKSARKAAARKVVKKATARKAATRKAATKKSPAKKSAVRKSAKKPARKTVAKKKPAKKAALKSSGKGRRR